MPAPENLSIKINRSPEGHYQVLLGDLDVTRHLYAIDGVKVEFVDDHLIPTRPTVTLKFHPYGTDLDLDVALTDYLAEKADRERVTD